MLKRLFILLLAMMLAVPAVFAEEAAPVEEEPEEE
mgnify:CR=1 FL=1